MLLCFELNGKSTKYKQIEGTAAVNGKDKAWPVCRRKGQRGRGNPWTVGEIQSNVFKNLISYLKIHLITLPSGGVSRSGRATPARTVILRRLASVVGGHPASPSSFPKDRLIPTSYFDAFSLLRYPSQCKDTSCAGYQPRRRRR